MEYNKSCNVCGDDFIVSSSTCSEAPLYKKTCGECIDLVLYKAVTRNKLKELNRFCCPVCKTKALPLDSDPHLCARGGEDSCYRVVSLCVATLRCIMLSTRKT